ncbi:AHH domain-containing protein [Herpetosiphon llansteffanensis]|uniref:AHH domain-containing protein n=1 Tax=Herpetosiphon llansteffanensis TaxID=2094568 RepID=UPI0013E02070|nr:AHH domain-containing protein [Herpetosiphon llansteffanensis]
MQDELWKFNYRAQLFHDFISNMDSVWQDSAAKTIRQRYITPHTENDQRLRQALNDQATNHEQAYKHALQVEALVIDADQIAQTIRETIEQINHDLRQGYSELKFADQQTNKALAQFLEVQQLLNQAGGCCGPTEGPSFEAALFSGAPRKTPEPPKANQPKAPASTIRLKPINSSIPNLKRPKRVNVQVLGFARLRYFKHKYTHIYKKLRNKASSKLRDNLVNAGFPDPDKGYAAHHIIPFGEVDLYLSQARLHLEKFGIDINDAHNGVFLPTKNGIGRLPNHRKIHTRRYFMYVYQRLSKTNSQAEVIQALNKIREDLLNGKFPY